MIFVVAVIPDGQSRITLDFACYGCHRDPDGVGSVYSMRTLSELSDMANNIHGTQTDVARDAIPAVVTLNTAYPNPFNPRTTVSFNVSRPRHLTVSVHDMAGQQVALLADQVHAAEDVSESVKALLVRSSESEFLNRPPRSFWGGLPVMVTSDETQCLATR